MTANKKVIKSSINKYHSQLVHNCASGIEPVLNKKVCSACNGSGRYDHNGSPKCSSCNGTGKDLVD